MNKDDWVPYVVGTERRTTNQREKRGRPDQSKRMKHIFFMLIPFQYYYRSIIVVFRGTLN